MTVYDLVPVELAGGTLDVEDIGRDLSLQGMEDGAIGDQIGVFFISSDSDDSSEDEDDSIVFEYVDDVASYADDHSHVYEHAWWRLLIHLMWLL